MPERRNIVLLTLDSLRADHCSFLGYNRKTTPTIDKVAKNGFYFENAIAPEVGTPPSMTSIFTGDYSLINPAEIKPEPWRKTIYERKTLAQVLSSYGYSTGAFNPNTFVSSYFGFNKGFSEFQDFISSNNGFFSHIYKKVLDKTISSRKKKIPSGLRNIRNLLSREEIFKPWETYYEDIVEWIKKSNEPFFLWTLSLDTHYPYLAPRKYRKWGNFFDMWYYNYRLQKDWKQVFSKNEKQKLLNAYDDSIYYADSFIKQLWNELKAYDPIFIIHADHGEAFGEHDSIYGHGPFLYEEFIHVPLVIYNADVKCRVKNPVSLRGLSPTIFEFVGVKNEFPSKSFIDGGNDWVISKVFENRMIKTALRTKDWKFITGQKKEEELYNLKKDPYEQDNVIEEHPELVKEIRKVINSHSKMERDRCKIRKSRMRLRRSV